MGAVGYTSTVSERDYYLAEQARERDEIETEPDAEREEIRDIYAAKGFSGELLDQVVGTISANRDRWLETMMNEELHLQPVGTTDILRSAVVITIATLIGHLIPLAPFMVLDRSAALVVALVASGLVLFGVGAYSAITLTGDWRRSGAQMVPRPGRGVPVRHQPRWAPWRHKRAARRAPSRMRLVRSSICATERVLVARTGCSGPACQSGSRESDMCPVEKS
jgi:hypothetical protein